MTDLEEHAALARLYQADTTSRVGKAMFDLVRGRIPQVMMFISFLPMKFELPSLCSEPKLKVYTDNYIRHTNKYDIWLRRSPVGPEVKTVRHGDYTPLSVLKRSLFYREVLGPARLDYGASLVVWQGEQWLATMTVFRNARQGDFSDAEMEQLRKWQIHFEVVVRRLAAANEARLDEDSLSNFIWGLPTAAIFMEWDLRPSHFTAAAVELCAVWRRGLSAMAVRGAAARMVVPAEILAAIPRLKPRIEAAKLARPGPLRPVEFETIAHPTIAGLSARIYFIPSKSLTLSRGRFLVELYFDRTATSGVPGPAILARLSRNERTVALEAAKGLSNAEIARVLRKSAGTVKVQLAQVFRKLRLKSRAQLASVLTGTGKAGLPAGALGHAAIASIN